MGYKIDLTGKRFGRLTVIGYAGETKCFKSIWHCKCDCGNEIDVRKDSLTSNRTKSCGCYRAEISESRKGKSFYSVHGLRYTKLYDTWSNMKARCYNENIDCYKHYGGRGIVICEEWRKDFKKFYDWSIENGYREDLTIDRIDTNGIYEPSNCRWVDRKTQSNNRRNTFYVQYKGKKYAINDLAKMYCLEPSCLRWRIDNNWDIEKALRQPSRRKKVV